MPMYKDLLEQFKQQVFGKPAVSTKEDNALQPYLVRFTYTTKEFPDRLFHGQTFCRDCDDGLRRAAQAIAIEKGDMAKLWLVDMTSDDPVMDLIVGKDDGDAILAISEDRVVSTLYDNYKQRVKEPRDKRKQKARENAKTQSMKPRVRLKSTEVIVRPGPTPPPRKPSSPLYVPYGVVDASKYVEPPPKPLVPIPAVQRSSSTDIIPWEEEQHMYD